MPQAKPFLAKSSAQHRQKEWPQFHFRPVSLAATQEFESIRLRMPETPYIFGMPLFLGYYWRDGHFRDPQLPEQSDHGNPFTF